MNKIYCPNCYDGFEVAPKNCKCGYPFQGAENDKQKFMAIQIKKNKTIKEGRKSAKYSRGVLFFIGGINFIISIIAYFVFEDNSLVFLPFIYSAVLIGFGFYSYKEPFFALLLGFIVLIFLYTLIGINDPMKILKGGLFKILFVGLFIYGLVKVWQAERVNKK
ncbi:MAG: hypothetical protein R2750_10155 [Bacteroidales bacterium]